MNVFLSHNANDNLSEVLKASITVQTWWAAAKAAAMDNLTPKKRTKRYAPSYDFKTLPDDALLPIDAVALLVGLAPGTLRNKVRDKSFPPPQHVSTRVIRWRYGVVKAWIREHGGDGALPIDT